MKNFSTDREIKSFWWAPNRPETRWFGTLTLARNAMPHLELVVESSSLFEDHKPLGRVLHGKDEHGKPIALLFGSESGSTNSGAVVKREFYAGCALLGLALSRPEEFLVNELRLQLQQLYGWLGITGFHRPVATAPGEFTIRYRRPAEAVFTVNSDLDVGVRFGCALHDGVGNQQIEEVAVVAFISKSGLSLKRCFELLGALRLLLNLASLQPVYPVRISALKAGHGRQVGDTWIPQEIEIWTSLIRETKSEPGLPELWLFRFDDFCGRFGAFFSEWLDFTVMFAEPLGCYSSTVYHPLTAELTHLSLTQALEAYHGIKFQSHEERDFKVKVEQLAAIHAGCLQGLVDRPTEFAEVVQATRNYYTHHNPSWKRTGKVAEGADLIRLNERLKLLFQVCVLTDLNIPAEHFGRLRRQLSTEIIEYV